jgi:hypothetical protein
LFFDCLVSAPVIPTHPRNKGAKRQREVKALNWLKTMGDIRVIAVRRDELPAVSERDAADFQTPSCMKNPEQGVMVG